MLASTMSCPEWRGDTPFDHSRLVNWSNKSCVNRAAAAHRAGDGVEQYCLVERLEQIGHRPRGQALGARFWVVVGRDDYDRQMATRPSQFALHGQAVQPWHVQVENDAIGLATQQR